MAVYTIQLRDLKGDKQRITETNYDRTESSSQPEMTESITHRYCHVSGDFSFVFLLEK